jgi:hypothetical protein
MDPNAAYTMLLDYEQQFGEWDRSLPIGLLRDLISEATDCVEGLHNWLYRKGFAPEAKQALDPMLWPSTLRPMVRQINAMIDRSGGVK